MRNLNANLGVYPPSNRVSSRFIVTLRAILATQSKATAALIAVGILTACSPMPHTERLSEDINLVGTWILEQDGSTMLDPQTSGLTYRNGRLFSVSDGSAHESQIQQLHEINPVSGQIVGRLGPIVLAPALQNSCFASYLSTRPDYEALVVMSDQANTWLIVTEDATRAGTLSEACQARFSNTGSSLHPTLVVKVELLDGVLTLTGVRAIQFDKQDQVGDFPNDGIEGMALTRDGRLLLGLEKDKNTQPRVFELALSDDFFEVLDEFAPVNDSGLLLPSFESGNHPINGMDVYYPSDSSQGYLIAAARNDNELWIMDLNKQKPSRIIELSFSVRCSVPLGPNPDVLNSDGSNTPLEYSVHPIANSALEGVAVVEDRLYLINDPWKKVYPDNTTCEHDQANYLKMAPMLFSMPLSAAWFN